MNKELLYDIRNKFNRHLVTGAGGHWVYVSKAKRSRKQFHYRTKRFTLNVSIHKLAWMLEYGFDSVPQNKHVNSTCGCENCVRIEHLGLFDKITRGENNPRHK